MGPKRNNINMNMQSNKSTFSNLISNIKSFDGDSEILDEFFSEFIELSDLAELNDRERVAVLKSKLSGSAKQFLNSAPELKEVTDIKVIHSEFAKFFKPCKSLFEIQSEFDKIKLGDHETIRSLGLRISMTAEKLVKNKDECDNLKLARLVAAVPAEFQKEILLKDPKTFNEGIEMLEKLQNVELRMKDVNAIPIVKDKENDNNNKLKDQEMRINALQNEIETLKAEIALNKGEHKASKYCSFCRRSNHSFEECFKRNRSRGFQPRGRFRGSQRRTPYNRGRFQRENSNQGVNQHNPLN